MDPLLELLKRQPLEPQQIRALLSRGLNSPQSVALARPADIAAACNLSEARADRLISEARNLLSATRSMGEAREPPPLEPEAKALQDLRKVEGVGRKLARRLHDGGYRTLGQLARALELDLVKRIGAPASGARRMIESATALYAEWLVAGLSAPRIAESAPESPPLDDVRVVLAGTSEPRIARSIPETRGAAETIETPEAPARADSPRPPRDREARPSEGESFWRFG